MPIDSAASNTGTGTRARLQMKGWKREVYLRLGQQYEQNPKGGEQGQRETVGPSAWHEGRHARKEVLLSKSCKAPGGGGTWMFD